MAEEHNTSLWRSRLGRWIEGVAIAIVGAAVWSWLTFVHTRFRWFPQDASWAPIRHGLVPWLLAVLAIQVLIVALFSVRDYSRGKRGHELRQAIRKRVVILPVVLFVCAASLIIVFAIFSIATGRPAFGEWIS